MGSKTPLEGKEPRQYNKFLKFSGLGLQLVLSIGISAFAGYHLDKYFENRIPICLLLFVLISFAGSMYKLFIDLNKE